jgi:trans-aconitate methyltransferase
MLGGALAGRKKEFRRIAIVGLGAGTIPFWLSQVFPSAKLDVVDVSADVIAAASCFAVPQSSTVQLIHEDGRKYLTAQADRGYDAIFVDAFIKNCDEAPPCLKTVEFFKMISQKLAPDGVLSMNIVPEDLDVVVGSALQAFPTSFSIQIGSAAGLGNNVLLARAPAKDAMERNGLMYVNPTLLQANSWDAIDADGWFLAADFRSIYDHPLTLNMSSADGLNDAHICHSFA